PVEIGLEIRRARAVDAEAAGAIEIRPRVGEAVEALLLLGAHQVAGRDLRLEADALARAVDASLDLVEVSAIPPSDVVRGAQPLDVRQEVGALGEDPRELVDLAVEVLEVDGRVGRRELARGLRAASMRRGPPEPGDRPAPARVPEAGE